MSAAATGVVALPLGPYKRASEAFAMKSTPHTTKTQNRLTEAPQGLLMSHTHNITNSCSQSLKPPKTEGRSRCPKSLNVRS